METTLSEEQRNELLEIIGDTQQIARELAAFKVSAQVFSSGRPRLIDEHPEEWVAVSNSDVIAAASLEDLFSKLEQDGIPREHAVIRYIDRNQRAFIL